MTKKRGESQLGRRRLSQETSVWRTGQAGVAQTPSIGNGCSLRELGSISEASGLKKTRREIFLTHFIVQLWNSWLQDAAVPEGWMGSKATEIRSGKKSVTRY